MFLHETLLPTRYYLSATSVCTGGVAEGKEGGGGGGKKAKVVLTKSETTTFCPYKGQASYYHLQVGETVIEDAVWYYTYPTQESAAIQGRLCFYNEKVDVFVDGVMVPKK